MSAQKIVRISNDLVRCVQKLKISEKRLLMLVVSKATDDTVNDLIPITAVEYADFYSVDLKSCYRTMRAAHERLWERSFDIGDTKYRWVITCRYADGEGRILVRIHPDIQQHISHLKFHYTQYYLRRAGEFKRSSSWRLFELLMQFRKTGILKISVSEFKEVLEVPQSYNEHFALIRHKVIIPALKEIKAAGLPVKLKTEKKGRSIHMLIFTFPLEQQSDWVANAAQQISGANSKQRITKKQIEKHAKPGESYSEAQERLQRELDNQQKEVQHQKSA